MAMFEVTAPSLAFRVETNGFTAPCGHNVRKPSDDGGTTVALSTKAWAAEVAPQSLKTTLTSTLPLKGAVPAGLRVSMTRHGSTLYSDNPPVVNGAKYPLTSMTRSELLVTNTETSPLVPAGTMAALAVTAPVGAFSVETRG